MTGARRTPRSSRIAAAGLWAATLSGAPSTAWAVLRRDDPLAATLAAGTMLLPDEARRSRLVPAAAAVHLSLSIGWTAVLDAALHRGQRTPAGVAHVALRGALAGLGIAALDLGLAHASRGRRLAGVRALPVLPQVADHAAYGAVAAVLLARSQ